MLNTLQISDFKMHSRNQAENFEIFEYDLKKKVFFKYTILKMKRDVRLKSNSYPFLKMKNIIRLELNKFLFLKNQLVLNHIKPP